VLFSLGYFAPGAFGIRDRNFYQAQLQQFAESVASAVESTASLRTSAHYAPTWSATATSLNRTAHALAKTQVVNRFEEAGMLETVLALLTDERTGVFHSCRQWE